MNGLNQLTQGQQGFQQGPQQGPSTQEMKAQLVAIMNQTGVPVPPKPSKDELIANGADADDVHEIMHIKQAQGMAHTITQLSQELIAARDVLEQGGENADVVARIDNTLNVVSVQSLTTSKLALDLQEIEQEMRNDEAQDFELGGYL